MTNYKKLLFKKYEKFDVADSDELRHLLKFEIKNIIDEVDSPDAQDLHMLGLVFYDTLKDSHDLVDAHNFFIQALKIDPKYNMARLYSAHCFQDKGELQEALKNYLLVDTLELKSDFALWRYVKLKEQIGYCYHKLGNLDGATRYFNEVLDFYYGEPFDELANPVEIYECLEDNDKTYKALKLIEKAHYSDN